MKDLKCKIIENGEELKDILNDGNFALEIGKNYVNIIKLAKCNIEGKETKLYFCLLLEITDDKNVNFYMQEVFIKDRFFDKKNNFFLIEEMSKQERFKSIMEIFDFYKLKVNAYEKDIINSFLINFCYDVSKAYY